MSTKSSPRQGVLNIALKRAGSSLLEDGRDAVRGRSEGDRAQRRLRRSRIAFFAAAVLLLLLPTLATTQRPLNAQLPGGVVDGGREDPFAGARESMVDLQVRKRGIEDQQILGAMERVPRHLFVPEPQRPRAYEDEPITIAPNQTLSQAFLSARMISLLELDGDEKVLEIGTGSGYDAALLSRLAAEVWTIEIDPKIATNAQKRLEDLGYENVHVRQGDGYHGWPEAAPFDAILVTAAPSHVPQPLYDQLAVGGKMVVAVGDFVQDLKVITRTEEGRIVRKVSPVVLGPMTGEVDGVER